jgi:lipopolysaccharide transport system ATP-binding protein
VALSSTGPSAVTSPAISIVDVSKKFSLSRDRPSSIKEALLGGRRSNDTDFWALRNVSFDIPKGSFYGIIGHNGSGKSTLLRLCAGIHKPTSGRIDVDGRVSALLELGSGFHPDLTGRENVFLNGAMLGLGKKQMAAAIDEIAEFSGIGDFIDAPVKVYSSGMHVRLGFAIAVHVEPEILLVDEVLAVGDEEFQRKCFDHIYSLRRKGTTIVLVSHDAGTMETLCDEVAWLDHGELQQSGSPTGTIEAYLNKVNAQENERLSEEIEAATEAEPTVLAVDDAHRRGSGEIRVTKVTYHDVDGSPRQSAGSGDPLIIRLWYTAASTVRHPVFGIGIYHENGTHLAGPNNKLAGVEQPIIEPGSGFLDIEVDRMTLLPGMYFITTGVYSADVLHCFDSWDRAHKMPVQPGSSIERHGMLELPNRWTTARPQTGS